MNSIPMSQLTIDFLLKQFRLIAESEHRYLGTSLHKFFDENKGDNATLLLKLLNSSKLSEHTSFWDGKRIIFPKSFELADGQLHWKSLESNSTGSNGNAIDVDMEVHNNLIKLHFIALENMMLTSFDENNSDAKQKYQAKIMTVFNKIRDFMPPKLFKKIVASKSFENKQSLMQVAMNYGWLDVINVIRDVLSTNDNSVSLDRLYPSSDTSSCYTRAVQSYDNTDSETLDIIDILMKDGLPLSINHDERLLVFAAKRDKLDTMDKLCELEPNYRAISLIELKLQLAEVMGHHRTASLGAIRNLIEKYQARISNHEPLKSFVKTINGAELDTSEYEYPGLMELLCNNRVEELKALKQPSRRTLLEMACHEMDAEFAHYLLDNGCPITKQCLELFIDRVNALKPIHWVTSRLANPERFNQINSLIQRLKGVKTSKILNTQMEKVAVQMANESYYVRSYPEDSVVVSVIEKSDPEYGQNYVISGRDEFNRNCEICIYSDGRYRGSGDSAPSKDAQLEGFERKMYDYRSDILSHFNVVLPNNFSKGPYLIKDPEGYNLVTGIDEINDATYGEGYAIRGQNCKGQDRVLYLYNSGEVRGYDNNKISGLVEAQMYFGHIEIFNHFSKALPPAISKITASADIYKVETSDGNYFVVDVEQVNHPKHGKGYKIEVVSEDGRDTYGIFVSENSLVLTPQNDCGYLRSVEQHLAIKHEKIIAFFNQPKSPSQDIDCVRQRQFSRGEVSPGRAGLFARGRKIVAAQPANNDNADVSSRSPEKMQQQPALFALPTLSQDEIDILDAYHAELNDDKQQSAVSYALPTVPQKH